MSRLGWFMLAFVAWVAMTCAICVGLPQLKVSPMAPPPPAPPPVFSSEAWLVTDPDQREELARAYLASQQVVGRSLIDVLSDLGPPTYYWYDWCYAVSVEGLGPTWRSVIPSYTEVPIVYAWFDLDHRLIRFDGVNIPTPAEVRPFDSDEWCLAARFPNERQPMVPSLVKNDSLNGASRDDIRRVLGPPDHAEIILMYQAGWLDGSDKRFLRLDVDISDHVVRAGFDE
jgi:hypothetical protein